MAVIQKSYFVKKSNTSWKCQNIVLFWQQKWDPISHQWASLFGSFVWSSKFQKSVFLHSELSSKSWEVTSINVTFHVNKIKRRAFTAEFLFTDVVSSLSGAVTMQHVKCRSHFPFTQLLPVSTATDHVTLLLNERLQKWRPKGNLNKQTYRMLSLIYIWCTEELQKPFITVKRIKPQVVKTNALFEKYLLYTSAM